MEPTTISAGRVFLRVPEPADAPAVLAAGADPQIARWTALPTPYGDVDAQLWLGRTVPEGWATGRDLAFAVCDAVGGDVLGAVGLARRDAHTGIAEVGYWLLPQARGRGLATEAVRAVTRWGFGALGLERIELPHLVGNAASCAVARRCGYAVEGVKRSAFVKNGQRGDLELHARLATDPEPAAGDGLTRRAGA